MGIEGNMGQVKDNSVEKLMGFLDDGKHPNLVANIKLLEQKDPNFLKEVLASTKDLMELSESLKERNYKALKDSGINLVQDTSSPETRNLSTPEGVKGSKLDAPSLLNGTVDKYEAYMKREADKTPFDGLSAEQSQIFLESLDGLSDGDMYTNTALRYQRKLIYNRGNLEELKQVKNLDIFDKVKEKMIAWPMFMAKVQGKLAKMKHAPSFAFDKLKSSMEMLLSGNK